MSMILAVRHVPHESLGTLEGALQAAGLTPRYVDVWREPLPDVAAPDVAGVVVLGGPMNVDQVDEYPFLRDEPAWIARACAAGRPLLGICLGSQLLAKAVGGRVHAAPHKEIGWYEVELLAAAAGDRLLGGLAPRQHVFQWHGDTFELPPGAIPLARGEAVAQQAFRWGDRAWGLQFHIEVTPAIIDDWLEEPAGRCEIEALDYIDPDVIRRETPAGMARMGPWADIVWARFAELCRDAARG